MAVKPSVKIIADAFPIRTVTDSRGRRLSWKRMTILERARFLRAVGSEHSANNEFVIMAMVCCMVQDIDGVPQPAPRTLVQVDGAIERVADDGYQAISDDLVVMAAEITAAELETDTKN